MNGTGQDCAFCGSGDVAWVHPLAPGLVTYEVYGAAHTLPGAWFLCEPCERIYAAGDDDAAVEVMRAHWSWVTAEDVAECIRQPLAVFRRADLGPRRVDPESRSLVEARERGFVPLREVTGVDATLGPLWPAAHRLRLDEPDGWLVRSPWPSLSLEEALRVLWRQVERDPFPEDHEVWRARVLDVLAWSDHQARAYADSD